METIDQCSKETETTQRNQRKYACKLTKSDDEGEYSLALLPEGTAAPALGGMTLT